MDLQKFRSCLSQSEPPKNLSLAVQALWWDAKGDWDKAHACAQAQDDVDGAWVHAYLHRKEGDTNNAAYWYRCAGKALPAIPLDEEWEALAKALIGGLR